MNQKLIEIQNMEKELYGYIEKTMQSDFGMSQKVSNILARCRDFEHRTNETP